MKELSIEEKAKRYDEAIKKAEVLYKTAEPMSGCNVLLETVFPELAESEDGKIRKALINGFNKLDKSAVWYNGITNAQILAWLEKQAEHANFRNKIQIGDKVTRNRDGVLVNLSQLNRVAKKDEKQDEQKSTWGEEDEAKLKSILFHIEDVENKDVIDWLKSLKDRVQPKQEWSEEDENTRKKIIKFLKEQNYFDGKANEFKEPYKKEYEWLKSLKDKLLNKPQSQWKPSEEQIEILDMVLTNESMDDNIARILRELQEALKKLKGE